MGSIAVKRGVKVIRFGLIEDVDLPDNEYDVIVCIRILVRSLFM